MCKLTLAKKLNSVLKLKTASLIHTHKSTHSHACQQRRFLNYSGPGLLFFWFFQWKCDSKYLFPLYFRIPAPISHYAFLFRYNTKLNIMVCGIPNLFLFFIGRERRFSGRSGWYRVGFFFAFFTLSTTQIACKTSQHLVTKSFLSQSMTYSGAKTQQQQQTFTYIKFCHLVYDKF